MSQRPADEREEHWGGERRTDPPNRRSCNETLADCSRQNLALLWLADAQARDWAGEGHAAPLNPLNCNEKPADYSRRVLALQGPTGQQARHRVDGQACRLPHEAPPQRGHRIDRAHAKAPRRAQ